VVEFLALVGAISNESTASNVGSIDDII